MCELRRAFVGALAAALVFAAGDALATRCESISQTPINNPKAAWLAAVAPPWATNITPVFYARAQESSSWSVCPPNTPCNFVAFPPAQLKMYPPENYYFYWTQPIAASAIAPPYVFTHLAQARLGVQYDQPSPDCMAMQILEVSPNAAWNMFLLAPAGNSAGPFRTYKKINIVPPALIPNWSVDCVAEGTCAKVWPVFYAQAITDAGGDEAQGYFSTCSNYVASGNTKTSIGNTDACLIVFNYAPLSALANVGRTLSNWAGAAWHFAAGPFK